MSIVDDLLMARLAAGFSRKEVGQEAGIKQSSLCAMELHVYDPTIPNLARWQDAMVKLLQQRAEAIQQHLTRITPKES